MKVHELRAAFEEKQREGTREKTKEEEGEEDGEELMSSNASSFFASEYKCLKHMAGFWLISQMNVLRNLPVLEFRCI